MLLNVHSKTFYSIISFVLIVCFITIPFSSLLYPQKAEAVCTPFAVHLPPNPLAVLTDGSLSPTAIAKNVQSGTEFFKTCVLNGLATVIAKQIIKQLTGSIVRWINSGFKGNPSFVQNPGKFFGAIGDQVAGNVIEKIAPFLCSPFRLNIQLALALNQAGGQDELSCTLTDVEHNFKNFSQGNMGSWDSWFQITQVPQNNPYGAMMIAQAQLTASITTAQGKYQQQLDWGKGFLSFESCPSAAKSGQVGAVQAGTAGEVNVPGGGSSAKAMVVPPRTSNSPGLATNNTSNGVNTNSLASVGSLGFLSSIMSSNTNDSYLALAAPSDNVSGWGSAAAKTQAPTQAPSSKTTANTNTAPNLWAGTSLGSSITNTSVNKTNPNDKRVDDANGQAIYGTYASDNGCITQTPGAVIESQLENSLGSDLRGLEIAQSIDQIFAALVGQLMSQVMGGIGGLAGAGSSSSSGGGSSFNYQGLLNAGVGPNAPAGSVVIPDLPIAGSCTPNTQNAQIGDTVTWDVYVPDINGNVTYTWYGDENLSGNTSSVSTSYTTNGVKTASVIVTPVGTTGTQGVQIDCIPNVQIGNTSTATSTPTISCASSPSTVSLSTPTAVTWQAVAIGGIPPFTYAWQGDDGLNGVGQTVTNTYSTAGTKTATVQVTDANGTTYSSSCSNTVDVTP